MLRQREEKINVWFEMWVGDDITPMAAIFADDVEYTECWGYQYFGQEEIQAWFEDWHKNNVMEAFYAKDFLHMDDKQLAKAVVYQKNEDDSFIIAFIRGDLEINETKLRNHLGFEIHPAVEIPAESGIVPGFIGPVGLPKTIKVVMDASLKGIESLVCGANETDMHYTGMNIQRDFGDVEYVDVAKTFSGAICPKCGKPHIYIEKGIEIGNIFQLGKKYTESMGMTYLDENGERQVPIMGCYGIGVGRLAASVCEARHDDYGPIWPITIAPWEVHLCCVRSDDAEAKAAADELYESLLRTGTEVIYDDRNVRAGAMFSDADLLGVPVRVVVSPRNLKEGIVEIATRDKKIQKKVALADAKAEVLALVQQLKDEINNYEI